MVMSGIGSQHYQLIVHAGQGTSQEISMYVQHGVHSKDVPLDVCGSAPESPSIRLGHKGLGPVSYAGAEDSGGPLRCATTECEAPARVEHLDLDT